MMKKNRILTVTTKLVWLSLWLPFLVHADPYCLVPESGQSKFQDSVAQPLERDQLRVLIQRKANTCVITHKEKQLIEQFAKINQLAIDWVYVDFDWQLIPSLIEGRGDMIAAQDWSLGAGMQDQVDFTLPWADRIYKVVQRVDNGRINDYRDLIGRQIVIYQNSPALSKLRELEKTLTGLIVTEVPTSVSRQELMVRVRTGRYDLALIDSLFIDEFLPLYPELQAQFNFFSERRNMAWAVRSDETKLHLRLNQYLNQQSLTYNIIPTYFDDLTTIKNRGVIRVITNLEPAHYYVQDGNLYGFEYELLSDFAATNKLRLDVIVANSVTEMLQLLKKGKGDIVAASLPNGLLETDKTIQFTKAYNYASPVIIGNNNDEDIIDLRDLADQQIVLAHNSPYWEYLTQLKKQGGQFKLTKAPFGTSLEDVLKMVASDEFDFSIISSHQVKTKYLQELGLAIKFTLLEPLAHRWAIRSGNKQLRRVLNNYIDREYRQNHYNVLYAKYFRQQNKTKANSNSIAQSLSLSPYDDLTQVVAREHGFDWRLIIALMFQESRFDPNAYSEVGAEGLMQLILPTAEFMGVDDRTDPKASIDAGIRYLSHLRDKFEETISLQDRHWFTLASYNAGYSRVKNARKLAEKMGLDKDRWFDNVEFGMLALARYQQEDSRFCRCGQAVAYVREIRTRYFNYIRLFGAQSISTNYKPIKRRGLMGIMN